MNTASPVASLRPALPAAPATPTPAPLDLRATAVMTLLCLLWSLQQISLKAVAPLASPMLMIALRSAIAASLLGLLMWRRGEGLGAGRWRPGLLAGGLFGLEYLLVSQALTQTAASHVVVFLYTSPIFAALGLHLRLPAERLGPRQAGGIALAFGGIAWAFLEGHPAGAAGGGNALLWQHLFWFLAHPEVYVLILPAMGIVAEVLGTNTRRPLWGYRLCVYAIGVLGFLSFLVWAHHMFLTGMGTTISAFFQATTMIISIPSVVVTSALVLTLHGGSIRFNTDRKSTRLSSSH